MFLFFYFAPSPQQVSPDWVYLIDLVTSMVHGGATCHSILIFKDPTGYDEVLKHITRYTYPCHLPLVPVYLHTHIQRGFSNPRDLWPLRYLIRVARRNFLTKKTLTKTNTFKEHLQRAIPEACDDWDIWSNLIPNFVSLFLFYKWISRRRNVFSVYSTVLWKYAKVN